MKKILFLFLVGFISHTNLFADANEDLIKAVRSGDIAAAEKALAAGASLTYIDANGATVLANSIFQLEMAQWLIEKGANAKDPIALASCSDKYCNDFAKLLISKGANPAEPWIMKIDQAANARKLIADEEAKGKAANKMVIKAFKDQLKTAKVIENPIHPIWAAVGKSNLELVKLYLDNGAKTDIIDAIMKNNLLGHLAMTYKDKTFRKQEFETNCGFFEKVGLIVPASVRNFDFNRLGSAAELVKILKEKGVDINAANVQKLRPLTVALDKESNDIFGKQDENYTIARALVKYGADLKGNDPLREKTIDRLANIADAALLQSIIEAGFAGEDGVKLMIAGIGTPEQMQEYVLGKGTGVNKKFSFYSEGEQDKISNYTLLCHATRNNNMAMVKYLVNEKKADVRIGTVGKRRIQAYDQNGRVNGSCLMQTADYDPLFYAIETHNVELVKFLAEKGGLNNVVRCSYSIKIGAPPSISPTLQAFGIETCKVPTKNITPPQFNKDYGTLEIAAYFESINIDKY